MFKVGQAVRSRFDHTHAEILQIDTDKEGKETGRMTVLHNDQKLQTSNNRWEEIPPVIKVE